jgi:hypothetical protein
LYLKYKTLDRERTLFVQKRVLKTCKNVIILTPAEVAVLKTVDNLAPPLLVVGFARSTYSCTQEVEFIKHQPGRENEF